MQGTASFPLQRISLCLLVVLALASCRGEEPEKEPTAPALSQLQVQASWLWKGAFADGIPDDVFTGVAQRWLGGVEGEWKRPGADRGVMSGASPSAALRQLSHRGLLEDHRALGHLAAVHAHASCRLAREPEAFGPGLVDAYLLGALSCKSLGDVDGEKSARANAGSQALAAPVDPDSATPRSTSAEGEHDLASLVTPEVRVLEVRGERLEYLLLSPAQIEAAQALLSTWMEKVAVSDGGDEDVAQFVARAAGTSEWFAGPVSNLLPSAKSLLSAAPSGPGRLAQVEAQLEDAIGVWQGALRDLPRDGEGGLDAGGRSLLDRWFRRALYRDVGLLALDEGDAELALLCLEEAAGARGRVRPAAGLDPLMLAALARARYECNELQRAVELLDDIAVIPGWEMARPTARTIARVAVVGSGADAKVNR